MGMWKSRRDFQGVWEGWKAGIMAFHAFHTPSFPWLAFLDAGNFHCLTRGKEWARPFFLRLTNSLNFESTLSSTFPRHYVVFGRTPLTEKTVILRRKWHILRPYGTRPCINLPRQSWPHPERRGRSQFDGLTLEIRFGSNGLTHHTGLLLNLVSKQTTDCKSFLNATLNSTSLTICIADSCQRAGWWQRPTPTFSKAALMEISLAPVTG
jgi:hypothetical protein